MIHTFEHIEVCYILKSQRNKEQYSINSEVRAELTCGPLRTALSFGWCQADLLIRTGTRQGEYGVGLQGDSQLQNPLKGKTKREIEI